MTTIPQMECCTMLGIDPKTLRNWLRHAHLQFVAQPTDARLKCLTLEQVQQLAALHARPLPPPKNGTCPFPSMLAQAFQTPFAGRGFSTGRPWLWICR